MFQSANQRSIILALLAISCVMPGCCVPKLVWEPIAWRRRSLAIPDTFPLGSINRAHYHTMQTNGEAGDFVIHRNEFEGFTAVLNSAGRDHIMEIAARMPQVPFPVIVERSENNSDPELDNHRRQIVARILADGGNADAEQRTIVSQPYAKGLNAREGQRQYWQYLGLNGRGGFGGGGAGGGAGGGGGGGFGGGQF